ncbi:MAG: hypothetical protein QG667_1618, partial [Pseudomonadota bacterium]|nr:hypothetical protein [Pseudomonadota bacterium]
FNKLPAAGRKNNVNAGCVFKNREQALPFLIAQPVSIRHDVKAANFTAGKTSTEPSITAIPGFFICTKESVAGRTRLAERAITDKQLARIHRVEIIGGVAEFAFHLDAALLCQGFVYFLQAKHFQHVRHPLA